MPELSLSPLHRRILRIAFPTIFMNISVPLLGAVDTAVVGHLDAVHYVGAVGIGSLIFSVLYWGVSFLRMSVIGLASQSHGRGDLDECGAVLGRGLLLALVLGLAFIAARGLIASAAFGLIDATPAVQRYAESYFAIRVLAAPAALIGMVFTGWFYGMHRVLLPVAIQIGINAVNMILDIVFVFELGMAFDGVAWATVVTQYAGLVATVAAFFWVFPGFWRRAVSPAVFERRALVRLLALNGDLLIRTASLLAATFYFMARSAALGELILAANTILMQFRNLTAYGLDGFSTGAEVLVGGAIGSQRRDELHGVIRLALLWGGAAGVGFGLFYLLGQRWWLAAFTENGEVLALAGTFMIWVVIEAMVGSFAHILDGIYFGATATRTVRNAMLITVFAVYFPAFLVLERLAGNHGMWAAIVILMLTRAASLAVPLALAMRRPQWRLR